MIDSPGARYHMVHHDGPHGRHVRRRARDSAGPSLPGAGSSCRLEVAIFLCGDLVSIVCSMSTAHSEGDSGLDYILRPCPYSGRRFGAGTAPSGTGTPSRRRRRRAALPSVRPSPGRHCYSTLPLAVIGSPSSGVCTTMFWAETTVSPRRRSPARRRLQHVDRVRRRADGRGPAQGAAVADARRRRLA